MKKIIVSDLDGTLTESKSALSSSMAEMLYKVLVHHKVAIISGGDWPQFQNQFLSHFSTEGDYIKNLLLFPTSGAECYIYEDNVWKQVYDTQLTSLEKEKIMSAFSSAFAQTEMTFGTTYGDLIEDRGEQITFSGCGQQAPLAIKASWDPDQEKRRKIVAELQKEIPEFEITIGGATSIDITHKGVNKAYAIRKIEEMFSVSKDDIVFLGDALYEGGNDTRALETGVECIQVSGPQETEEILRSFTQDTPTDN